MPHLDEREGADAERRRLVGPGRFLRPGRDLRGAREARHARHRTTSSSGRGTTAAGAAARATRSARFRSAATPRSTSARRSRRRSSRYYLKDKGTLDLPEALTFEAGANEWRRWDAWPPKRTHATREAVLPRRTATLAFDAADATAATRLRRVRLRSGAPGAVPPAADPADLLPGGSKWSTWLVEDQRFVDDRPDVLSWETDAARRGRDDRRRR